MPAGFLLWDVQRHLVRLTVSQLSMMGGFRTVRVDQHDAIDLLMTFGLLAQEGEHID